MRDRSASRSRSALSMVMCYGPSTLHDVRASICVLGCLGPCLPIGLRGVYASLPQSHTIRTLSLTQRTNRTLPLWEIHPFPWYSLYQVERPAPRLRPSYALALGIV